MESTIYDFLKEKQYEKDIFDVAVALTQTNDTAELQRIFWEY
jgi:hypothetical protein